MAAAPVGEKKEESGLEIACITSSILRDLLFLAADFYERRSMFNVTLNAVSFQSANSSHLSTTVYTYLDTLNNKYGVKIRALYGTDTHHIAGNQAFNW